MYVAIVANTLYIFPSYRWFCTSCVHRWGAEEHRALPLSCPGLSPAHAFPLLAGLEQRRGLQSGTNRLRMSLRRSWQWPSILDVGGAIVLHIAHCPQQIMRHDRKTDRHNHSTSLVYMHTCNNNVHAHSYIHPVIEDFVTVTSENDTSSMQTWEGSVIYPRIRGAILSHEGLKYLFEKTVCVTMREGTKVCSFCYCLSSCFLLYDFCDICILDRHCDYIFGCFFKPFPITHS